MSAELPPLPFAVFDEFGVGADDRVRDYALAARRAALEEAARACDALDNAENSRDYRDCAAYSAIRIRVLSTN